MPAVTADMFISANIASPTSHPVLEERQTTSAEIVFLLHVSVGLLHYWRCGELKGGPNRKPENVERVQMFLSAGFVSVVLLTVS